MAPSAVPLPSPTTLSKPSLPEKETPASHSQTTLTPQKSPLALISQGSVSLPPIPVHPSFAAHRAWALEHMALAFRVFARKHYTEGMSGHISIRDPEFPHAFWTNPLGKHFGLLSAGDMVMVNYEGQVVGGNRSRPANAAGFLIHGAVHRAREDVVSYLFIVLSSLFSFFPFWKVDVQVSLGFLILFCGETCSLEVLLGCFFPGFSFSFASDMNEGVLDS